MAGIRIKQNYPQTKNSFEEEANFLHGLSGLTALFIINSDIFTQTYNSGLETQDILTLAIDAKDHYTYNHSQRTAAYAVKLGRSAGLNEEELEEIRLAALLHDVGKIGLPEKILLKPTKPTERERLVIQKHPIMSAEIIDYFKFASPQVALNVRHHHERVDGYGYPDNLKKGAIPLGARILSIVDAWDAMTAKRFYRPVCDKATAVLELIANKNIQFDEILVDLFLKIVQ